MVVSRCVRPARNDEALMLWLSRINVAACADGLGSNSDIMWQATNRIGIINFSAYFI